jgi:hypothetical protein
VLMVEDWLTWFLGLLTVWFGICGVDGGRLANLVLRMIISLAGNLWC